MEVVVETDPNRMAAIMLGIPGAHVLSVDPVDTGLRAEIECHPSNPRCPVCGGAVTEEGHNLVDLGVISVFGQSVTVVWRRRRWRCTGASCAGVSFPEEDEEFTAYGARVLRAR